MTAPPAVTVIIPARDAAGTLPALLDALAAQTLAPSQVLVVDDASTDATAGVVAAHPVGAVVLAGTGAGSYAARNLGLAQARGRVVAFTDADCVPAPTWIERGVAALAAGAVAGGVRSGDGAGAGTQLVGGRVEQRHRDDAGVWERYDRATYLDQRELVRQGFAATANLFADVDVLRGLGGFDGALRSSGDLELGRRATAAGLRLVYAHDAVVLHEPRTSAVDLWRLHRRLGAGWRSLARRGDAPRWWREPALRVPLGRVVELVAADGPALRRRHLAVPHAVVMAARWRGRLLG